MLYDIVLNIDISDGLINGAMCQIKKLPSSEQNVLRHTIWVYFSDSFIGRNVRRANRHLYSNGIDPHWTPIRASPETYPIDYGRHYITRLRFPLRPAHAKTIHRCQGDTLDAAVIDLSGSRLPHAHYVAISRVKSIEGLFFVNLNEKKVKVDENVRKEMDRLRYVLFGN